MDGEAQVEWWPWDSADPPRPPGRIDRHVGQRVHGRRTELKLTADEVARQASMRSEHLRAIEAGVAAITPNQLIDLAGILSVQLGYFFQGLTMPGLRR